MIRYIENYLTRLKYLLGIAEVSERTIEFFHYISENRPCYGPSVRVTDIGRLTSCIVNDSKLLREYFNLEVTPIVLLRQGTLMVADYKGSYFIFSIQEESKMVKINVRNFNDILHQVNECMIPYSL